MLLKLLPIFLWFSYPCLLPITSVREDKGYLNYLMGWRKNWENVSDTVNFLTIHQVGEPGERREISVRQDLPER